MSAFDENSFSTDAHDAKSYWIGYLLSAVTFIKSYISAKTSIKSRLDANKTTTTPKINTDKVSIKSRLDANKTTTTPKINIGN